MDRKQWSFELLEVWVLVWQYEKGYVGSSSGRDFSAEE